MVRRVHAGYGLRTVARQFGVSVSTVSLWVARSAGQRLDRVSFADHKRGRAWNRMQTPVEQDILQTRAQLREHSALGEYGANPDYSRTKGTKGLRHGTKPLRNERCTKKEAFA